MNYSCALTKGSLSFTKKVDYGLILLVSCAKNTSAPLSLKKIAEQYDISFFFLQKIAKDLKAASIIVSSRGKSGGYSLTRNPADISVKEVVEALEGPVAIMECERPNTTCDREHSCPLKTGIHELNEEVTALMLSKNLTHFIR